MGGKYSHIRMVFGSILLLIGTLMLGCISKEQPSIGTDQLTEDPNEVMSRLVRNLLKEADPVFVSYLAKERAQKYESLVERATDENQEFRYRLIYAYELLNAGENERAVIALEQLMSTYGSNQFNPDAVYEFRRLMALAYMRLGEVENCINRNGAVSCIFPIQDGGEYVVRRSAETAVRLYSDMLLDRPDDREAIWMLNLACMTLGNYPDSVPEPFRLPASAFDSEYELAPFENFSGRLGVNTMGISGGVCLEDFNRDGYLDIFTTSWDVRASVRLFFSTGKGAFEEVTEKSGLADMPGGLNVIHADYNNDGWPDIFILRGAWMGPSGNIPNSLLRNNGDGTFTDVTEASRLLSYHPTQAAVWADFNLDGFLDLFVANESASGVLHPCEFYINKGDGTFINRINQSGLSNLRGGGKGVAAGDVNNDGYPDLYLSNLEGANQLFILTSGTAPVPKFQEVTQTSGVEQPENSFPTWMWDFDQDGNLDIFVAAYQLLEQSEVAVSAAANAAGRLIGGHPVVYKNRGDGTFEDWSSKLNLKEAAFVMGANFGDIDNDGYPDVYLGTGDPGFTSVVPNKMYRNAGAAVFQDVTTSTQLGHIQKGHGIAFGDIDQDGDEDIFCVLGGLMRVMCSRMLYL